jgi:pyruvate carboxylase subunit B
MSLRAGTGGGLRYLVDVGGERLEVLVDGDAVTVDGVRVPAHLALADGSPLATLTVGHQIHRVEVCRGPSRGLYRLVVDGYRYDAEALDERSRTIRELSSAGRAQSGPAPLVAPMPGLIVRVLVQPGDMIAAGQGLVTMEAMKMENELRSSSAGTVRAVRVAAGAVVERGTLLVEIE